MLRKGIIQLSLLPIFFHENLTSPTWISCFIWPGWWLRSLLIESNKTHRHGVVRVVTLSVLQSLCLEHARAVHGTYHDFRPDYDAVVTDSFETFDLELFSHYFQVFSNAEACPYELEHSHMILRKICFMKAWLPRRYRVKATPSHDVLKIILSWSATSKSLKIARNVTAGVHFKASVWHTLHVMIYSVLFQVYQSMSGSCRESLWMKNSWGRRVARSDV